MNHLTRALERGGGQILPSPHVFCEYLSKYSFDRRDVFNTCPKINGAPFGAKNWGRVDYWGSIFKPPKSALSFFVELMPWRGCPGAPPPPHRLAGPGRSLGGGRWGGGGRPGARGAGRALGGGRRRPVKVTDSRERRQGEPSSGGYRTLGLLPE